MIEQMQGCLLVRFELFHGGGQIGVKVRGPCRSGLRGFRHLGRLPGELPAAPPCVAKLVVGDPEHPGQKGGASLELTKPPVGPQEGLLGEIVRKRGVSTQKVTQKAPDGGLVPEHKLTEGSAVVRAENTSNELGIRRNHAGAAFVQERPLPGGGAWSPGLLVPRMIRQNSSKATPTNAGTAPNHRPCRLGETK